MTNAKLQSTITELIQAYNSWDDAKLSAGAIDGLVQLLVDARMIHPERVNDMGEIEMLKVKVNSRKDPMLLFFE